LSVFQKDGGTLYVYLFIHLHVFIFRLGGFLLRTGIHLTDLPAPRKRVAEDHKLGDIGGYSLVNKHGNEKSAFSVG
jgi:hypothetical protein